VIKNERDTGRVFVWDAPTRIVHWLSVVCVGVSWWTAENRLMDYHRYSGYVLLALLAFRIYWGFAGALSARFAYFIKGPHTIVSYLRGAVPIGPHVPSHNPLGAWSVVAMLVLLVAQVTLGLFSVDVDGIESGPLSDRVSFDVGRRCAALHHLTFNTLLALIVLHIGAVAFYALVKRKPIVGAMLFGVRVKEREHEVSTTHVAAWRTILGVLVAALLSWAISKGLRF
jgi:cytochrome b